MPPPRRTPGTDGRKPIPGRRVDAERSFDRWGKGIPLNTPSSPAPVLLGRIHRKRPGDGADDGNVSNKRRRVSSTTPGSSPLVSDRGVLSGSGQRTLVIDLTDDAPEVNSSDSTRRVKSTTNTFLDSSPREAQSASRYGPPSVPSTPTPGAKQKIETIDLTLSDSDDDQAAPSTTRPEKTVQAAASESVIGLTNAKSPVLPEPFAGPSRQRSEPNLGQARQANSAQQKDATGLAQAQAQIRSSKFGTASQPGQLTDGSPGAFRHMAPPTKPAPLQRSTKKVLANGSMPAVHEREAAKYQLRRGYDSAAQVEMQAQVQDTGSIGDKTKDGERKGAARGRVDVGSPNQIESDADSDFEEKLLKTSGSKKLLPSNLRRLWPVNYAGNKPLPGSFPLQQRDTGLANSVQVRNGENGGHQAVEKDSAGEGDRTTATGESGFDVSVGARRLQKPLVLMNQGQAKKHSERVAGAHADGSNEGRERGSTGLLEIGRRDETRDELPPTPRGSRRKHGKVVVLRAPPDELRRISQRPVQRPDVPVVKDKCWLTTVPLEIQHRIYKYLLLADDPIQVLHGWAKLYQRQRSNLRPAILQTCRTIYQNACEVLYGGNVFRYMVRDRPESWALSFGQGINVEKYVPLFRKLELKIERSRTEHGYCTSLANAIHLLNTHGAKLHTLTLDVSPSVEGDTLSTVGFFYRDGDIIKALKTLRTCFIVVRVLTPKIEDQPATSLRRELDLRRGESIPNQPPEAQLDDLSEMITHACESPSKVVEQGWFEEFEVVPLQNERRARSSRIAYYDQDDDDDETGSSDKNGDGDNSGEYRG